MRDCLASSGQADCTDTEHFISNDDEELVAAGWVAGEVLAQALSNCRGVSGRKAFMASLFNQRRCVVDDLVVGEYGGECKGAAASQGATCRRNEGGRTVYMKRFVEGYRAEAVGGGRMAFRLSDCNVSNAFIAAGVRWGAPSDGWWRCCATCDAGGVVGFPFFLFRRA
ncbi:receptor-type adenylate cyclase [Trypanosoma rangeli]|uniref:Receptor-type adenylate cyclase n=1 Tax=Trypanosoma rangeli TaxID=5698 RepID=A0A422MT06_TRYRA|nr:receptor-type adenylate cyclase [Trypanosoma rangeli]RNE96331.1 receptor-type adenylate cyclase [Trypanosoma rangeli]|eukprot:RNE96331.1 receptor-type adenylate cyclase [Trypanosoma rangeli]